MGLDLEVWIEGGTVRHREQLTFAPNTTLEDAINRIKNATTDRDIRAIRCVLYTNADHHITLTNLERAAREDDVEEGPKEL